MKNTLPSFSKNAAYTSEEVKLWTDKFIADNTDGYQLSMGLLVAAYLGDEQSYYTARLKMQKAINEGSLPDWGKTNGSYGQFLTWMNGRMLVAASIQNNEAQIKAKQAELKTALDPLLHEQPTDSLGSACVAWGAGYYAYTLPENDAKTIDAQIALYSDKLTGGNQIWGWIMLAQAAAHTNDVTHYKKAVQGLGLDQPGGVDALYNRFEPGDFRAWGFAALSIATREMKETTLFTALQGKMKDAIASSPKEADKMLATVYNERAVAGLSSNPELKHK